MNRKGSTEGTADTGRTFDQDLTLMNRGNVLDDRKPQARTAQLSGAGFVHSIESFKDTGLILRRNSHSRILHFNEGSPVLGLEAGPDLPSPIGVLDGVVK